MKKECGAIIFLDLLFFIISALLQKDVINFQTFLSITFSSFQSIETDGATVLFSRSVEKLNLVYKIYIGDSDSKGYAIVYKAMPYEVNVFIEKEECLPEECFT